MKNKLTVIPSLPLLLISGFIFLFSSQSFAALPPYFQSRKEIIEILNDPKVSEKIGSGRVIDSITRTTTGYNIVARECTLEIKLNYLPNKDGKVGPVNYEFQMGEFTCTPIQSEDLEKD